MSVFKISVMGLTDAADRSNGFERKLFQRSNERSRADLEGYQWRSEDM